MNMTCAETVQNQLTSCLRFDRTFFVTFMGIVFLGVGHGLVFMPVVLSIVAPHTPAALEDSENASAKETPSEGSGDTTESSTREDV